MTVPPQHLSVEVAVLRFSRWYTAIGVAAFLTALMLAGSGVFLLVIANTWTAIPWLAYVIGACGLVEGCGMLWAGWYTLTHKPRLLLGRTRLQFWWGRHLQWDVSYRDITEISLFVPIHPLFRYRMPSIRALGFKLAATDLFDQTYPRRVRARRRLRRLCGFDLSVPIMFSYQPPLRCLEVVLRCYHAPEADGLADARAWGERGQDDCE